MNLIKTIKLILIFHLSTSVIDGQTLKNYSGTFENGKATYQYYENDQMDRVLQGNFSYTGSLFDMQGNFKDGNKNGKWTIKAQNKKYSNWRASIIINTQIEGNYINGFLDGYWQYKNTMQFDDDNNSTDIETSTATFKNNHFIGKVTYYANFPTDYKVTGQFNENGYVDGTWIYAEGNMRDEIRFYKGVAYWRLYNNTTTGEKKIFCDSTSFVQEFWKNYDPKIKVSNVNGKIYYPDTVLIRPEVRVLESNATYEGPRIINAIKIGDPSSSINYSFNPIYIWMQDNVDLYFAGAITNPLYYYKNGSNIPFGLQIIINECSEYTDCYKQRKEEERIQLIKEMLQLSVKKGDEFYASKDFKQALYQYYKADSLGYPNEVSIKISQSKKEIARIDSLQNLRYKIFSFLKKEHDEIVSEIPSLKTILSDNKKLYGKNYELCMNLLSEKFQNYFSELEELFNKNGTNGLEIKNTWNDIDKISFDLVLNFNKDFDPYSKFHSEIKLAVKANNTNYLKFLKSSDDLNKIISSIIN